LKAEKEKLGQIRGYTINRLKEKMKKKKAKMIEFFWRIKEKDDEVDDFVKRFRFFTFYIIHKNIQEYHIFSLFT
jgi:hypothetical protein